MTILIEGKTQQNATENVTLGSIDVAIESAKFLVYQFTATQLGTLTAQTSGTVDTVLSLYGSNETATIAFNDDYGETTSSFITKELTEVGTYYVVLQGYSTNAGATSLTVQFEPLSIQTPAPITNNIKIGYANLIDKATLLATGVSENLPVSNLKTLSRGQVFRGTANSQTIEITFSSVSMVGCIALWCPTFDLIDTDNFDATIYNGASVVHSVTNALQSAFFDEVSATKVVLTIRIGIVFDLSRIFVGRVFMPTHNLEFGFSTKFQDLSEAQRTEDGSLHIQKKAQYRKLTISLADITHDDRAKLVALLKSSGSKREVFVSIFNGLESSNALRIDHEIIGIIEDGAEISLTSPNRWNNKLVIEGL